jgi:hypothetical protein
MVNDNLKHVRVKTNVIVKEIISRQRNGPIIRITVGTAVSMRS